MEEIFESIDRPGKPLAGAKILSYFFPSRCSLVSRRPFAGDLLRGSAWQGQREELGTKGEHALTHRGPQLAVVITIDCRIGRSHSREGKGEGELLYCNPSTLAASSADPLRETKCQPIVQSAGWEPRGDNGPARGRLRATRPASCHPSKRYGWSRAGQPSGSAARRACLCPKRVRVEHQDSQAPTRHRT